MLGIIIFSTLCLPFLLLYALLFIIADIIREKSLTKRLKLEDIEFEKHYKIYSKNQIHGRYLVTPAFMERFKHIQTAFGSKNVKCSFYDKYIMFAVSTKSNAFEIGSLFCPITSKKNITKFIYEILSICHIIEYFKLNEHTQL